MRTAHSSSVSPSGRRGRAIREAAMIVKESATRNWKTPNDGKKSV
jgi:hypothetical protein